MSHCHHCVPLTRWWAGEWQPCSRSCGPEGLSRRAVLCIRSVGLEEQRSVELSACEHLPRPLAETPCNRHITCPSTWEVSVEVKGDLSLVSTIAWNLYCLVPEAGGSLGAFLGQYCSQSLGGQRFAGML